MTHIENTDRHTLHAREIVSNMILEKKNLIGKKNCPYNLCRLHNKSHMVIILFFKLILLLYIAFVDQISNYLFN